MYGNLMMPQHEFYNYIDELENIFINRFPQIFIENEVGIKLKLSMTNVVFRHPCPLFKRKINEDEVLLEYKAIEKVITKVP